MYTVEAAPPLRPTSWLLANDRLRRAEIIDPSLGSFRSSRSFPLSYNNRPSLRTWRAAVTRSSILPQTLSKSGTCAQTAQMIEGILKILVAIANYGTKNDQYLAELLAEYRSMSHQVKIVVLSNVFKKLDSGVELLVGVPNKDPWSLPFTHKQLFADRLEDYDLFIYSEDDTLITENNIRAFLRVNETLNQNEVPGFLRFERGSDGTVNYPEIHGHFHWDTQSVRVRDSYTLAGLTNEHSACYVLTREQLRSAIDSRGFLNRPHQGKYDLLCTAATDPYTQCGLQKLICISHLEDFLIHHLPNKYVVSKFGVEERELRRQVEALLRIGRNGKRPTSLFQTESKFPGGRYSKNYYEPVRPEVVSVIPSTARNVLSIGCGWGATEGWLAEKGLRVVAIPLDPVIPGGAEAKGVEIVKADMATARAKLAGERFDCLLLLNVLHLVPDPVSVLSSFGELLSAGASAIVSVPNLSQLPVIWRRIRGDERYRDLGNYGATGVHVTSQKTVRGWLQRAGMRLEKTTYVLPHRAQRGRRLRFGVGDSVLASEIVGVGIRT